MCGLEVEYDGYGSDDDDGLGIVGGRIEWLWLQLIRIDTSLINLYLIFIVSIFLLNGE
jgi:hypothetical protein